MNHEIVRTRQQECFSKVTNMETIRFAIMYDLIVLVKNSPEEDYYQVSKPHLPALDKEITKLNPTRQYRIPQQGLDLKQSEFFNKRSKLEIENLFGSKSVSHLLDIKLKSVAIQAKHEWPFEGKHYISHELHLGKPKVTRGMQTSYSTIESTTINPW